MRLKQLQKKIRQKLYSPVRSLSSALSFSEEIAKMEKYLPGSLKEILGSKRKRISRRR